MKIFLLDNYDSFTYNLYNLVVEQGIDCQVYRNDEISCEEIEDLNPDAILLSPGPQRPSDAGILMDVINVFHQRLPILGVCLGHEAIGEFFGMKLHLAEKPMHGKTSEVTHDAKGIYQGINNPTTVMRYHSLILTETVEKLKITAVNETNEIMGIRHIELPIEGVQFHPESILTSDGNKMIGNWVKSIS